MLYTIVLLHKNSNSFFVNTEHMPYVPVSVTYSINKKKLIAGIAVPMMIF